MGHKHMALRTVILAVVANKAVAATQKYHDHSVCFLISLEMFWLCATYVAMFCVRVAFVSVTHHRSHHANTSKTSRHQYSNISSHLNAPLVNTATPGTGAHVHAALERPFRGVVKRKVVAVVERRTNPFQWPTINDGHVVAKQPPTAAMYVYRLCQLCHGRLRAVIPTAATYDTRHPPTLQR